MCDAYQNILSSEDISYIYNLPEVHKAKQKLESSSCNMIYFSIQIPDFIKTKLENNLNINLSNNSIPMRWIKGDTKPHIDHGASPFDNTYLMYLNDSPGNLIVDNKHYSISKGSTYVFNEGLYHETVNTENVPRLLLGPMSEYGIPVGYAPIYYFPTKKDALTTNYSKELGYNYYPDYVVGNIYSGNLGGRTKWKIASNSNGSSSKSRIYKNGDTLNNDFDTAYYYLYPVVNNKPKSQRQALNQSLNLSPIWKAYKYYRFWANELGFDRITFIDYKKNYYNK